MRAVMAVGLLIGAARIAGGQEAPPAGAAALQTRPPLAFDVASIKPAAKERALRNAAISPDRFFVANLTLRSLIESAYGMPQFRVVRGPEWMESERWEISARAGRVSTPAEMRAMLQHLMAERFGLKTHLETRELPTYTLVLARGDGRLGPNMKPAVVDCEPFRSGQRSMPALEDPNDVRRPCALTSKQWGGGVLTEFFAGTSTTRLAKFVETRVERVIVDKTGLTGSFDIELTFEDEETRRRFTGSGKPREAPPLPTALHEQLGLRLVPSRGPVDVLVIDSVQRPIPD